MCKLRGTVPFLWIMREFCKRSFCSHSSPTQPSDCLELNKWDLCFVMHLKLAVTVWTSCTSHALSGTLSCWWASYTFLWAAITAQCECFWGQSVVLQYFVCVFCVCVCARFLTWNFSQKSNHAVKLSPVCHTSMTAACNHIIFWKCFKSPKVYEGRKYYWLKTAPLLYTTFGEDIMCFLILCNGN